MSRPLRTRAGLVLVLALPLAARPDATDVPPPSFGEEVVVVGARRRAAAADPTASATIVEAQRFAGEAKGLAELLATSPGVVVRDPAGLGQLSTISIRGAPVDGVLVLVDGLQLNTAAGGGVDLSRIPRGWIERIEVVRGAEGAQYGSGALGGAVNVITRRGRAGSWSAEVSGGSFRTWSAALDGAAGGERWGLAAALAGEGSGGRFPYAFDPLPTLPGNPVEERQREHDAALQGGGLVKAWSAVGEGRLDALVFVAGGRHDLPGSPYAPTPLDGQSDRRAAATARAAFPLPRGFTVAVEANGRYDRLDLHLASFGLDQRQRDLAGAARAVASWVAGPSTVTLSASAGAERLDAEGAPARSRPEYALAVSDELMLIEERLRLTGALRLEWIGPFAGWSAKLGGAVRVAGPLSVRASLGRTFRAPSFGELYLQQGLLSPNPDLAPEEALSADVAVVAEGAAGLASLGGFGTLYRDLVVYVPGSFGRMAPLNAGKALARGVEAELASAPAGPLHLTALASYTLLLTETLRGDASELGRALPHRPEHALYGRLAGGAGPVEVHADARWVSAQWLDTRNLVPVPSLFTLGTGASVRLWRRPEVRAHVEVKNLLDDRTLQDGFGYPLPGRSVMITLRAGDEKEHLP